MTKLFLLFFLLLLPCALLAEEADPAKREDAAIERQRMMQAADQIQAVNEQVNKMQQDVNACKQDVENLRTENYKLKQQLALAEVRHAREREVILAEVAKTIARANKEREESVKAAEKAATKSESDKSEKTEKSEKNEKGYEYTVQKGQTLWIIVQAYKQKGVNVSVDDIRKANNLKPNAPLRVGQKIFIPAK